MRIRLPIPRHKVSRLILPCGLMLAGFVIFLCGLVRTFHIDEAMTKTQTEEYVSKTTNEYMEWWIGLPLMACSIFAICAVYFDRPLLSKLCVLALGTCFVPLLFALLLDAGEFSFVSQQVNYYRFLEKEGFECKTDAHEFEDMNHTYYHRECLCMKDQKIGNVLSLSFSVGLYRIPEFGFFVDTSCEVLFAQYYLYAVMTFAICCAIGLTLFTLFAFVLILIRISQITTLHLDEKPLIEEDENTVSNEISLHSTRG